MKIVSANVNGRVKSAARRQLDAVLEHEPDVVALQEVTTGNYSDWCQGLTRAGYSVLSTVDPVALPYPPPPYPSPPFPARFEGGRDQIRRTNFNLLAARHPIAALPGLSFPDPEEARFGFPEKFVAARVSIAGLEVDVHNAHVPPGAGRGLLKVHAFEAIRRRLDEQPDRPRVLCGDFNAPWDEDADGPRIEPRRKWPEEIKQRWVEAERAIVANPELSDVYRDVHRPGQPFPASHFTGRGQSLTGHRYDYVFATGDFETRRCEYLTGWLERDDHGRRLSDHAPVIAELAVGQRAAQS
jgi:exonuclease III